jgi:S1-C subfamily serine protease
MVAGVLAAATVVSGCGSQENPAAATLSTDTPQASTNAMKSVEPPDPQLVSDPVVAAVKAGVVKIDGTSPNCSLGGSGVVVAPDRVMATADMLAGGTTFTVEAAGQERKAQVVSFDPGRDLAILAVPNLPAPALSFATDRAADGSDAVLLGYPEDEDGIRAIPARVREVIELNGPDIYREHTVSREVYTIRGSVPHGLAGGPLINTSGEVIGIAFGAAIDDADTGFVLTASEIGERLSDIGNTAPVATGREVC